MGQLGLYGGVGVVVYYVVVILIYYRAELAARFGKTKIFPCGRPGRQQLLLLPSSPIGAGTDYGYLLASPLADSPHLPVPHLLTQSITTLLKQEMKIQRITPLLLSARTMAIGMRVPSR